MCNTPSVIILPEKCGFDDAFDICYAVFKERVMKRDNRPDLNGSEIYIPCKEENWIEGKSDLFWHASSMEPHISFDIAPCVNDRAESICPDNCTKVTHDVFLSDGTHRAKCPYRAERVSLISLVISLYNAGDPRVTYWEKDYKDSHGTRRRICLRFIDNEIDYMLVFERKSEKRVRMITAFPVFFRSDRRKYDKEYAAYAAST